MKILLDLLKKYEGCRLKAYKCPAGVLTIGWGHTGSDVTTGQVITQAHADHLLELDAGFAFKVAGMLSPVLKKYPTRQMAIASFIFNLGQGAYKKSTLKKKIDNEDWIGSAIEIRKWVNANGQPLPGLIKRRTEEAELLLHIA